MEAALRLAQRQHALITRQQALAAGMTLGMMKSRIRTGTWRIVRPGVYAVVGAPATWEQAVMAVCLFGGDGTLAASPTAARLWGLARAPRSAHLHVLSESSRRVRLDGVIAHRTGRLPMADRSKRNGVPVTSVARTIVDTSALLSVAATATMLDDAMRRRLVHLEAVRACVARLAGPGRRRLVVVRAVLAKRLPGWDPGDSDLEVAALRLIVRAGLPQPLQQHVVLVDGRRHVVDLAYPKRRIAIELDGWEFHRFRGDFDRDHRKVAALQAAGWLVLRFTSETLTDLVPVLTRVLANS